MSIHDGTPGSYFSISIARSRQSAVVHPGRRYPPPMGSRPVLRDFSDDDVARVRALADAVEAATGIVPLGDDAWTGMHAMAGRDRGVFDESGDGYAHVARHHDDEWSIELVARPGTAVDLDALLTDAVDAVAAGGGGHVTYWVHGTEADPDAETRATGAGFVAERDLLQMRVAL